MADFDAETVRRWFVLVYGEERAEEAMMLPAELQRKLYPELMQYGPAGLQIQEFFSALLAAAEAEDPTELLLVAEKLETAFWGGNWQRFQTWVAGRPEECLYDSIAETVEVLFVDSHADMVVFIASFIPWALTASWLPAEIAEVFTAFTHEVNAVLIELNLPTISALEHA